VSTSLTGINQQTEWFDLRAMADNVTFTLTGNFSGAVGIHYSNNELYAKGTDYAVGAATSIWPVSAAGGPFLLPFGISKFVRFFSSNPFTGTCQVEFGLTKNSNGGLLTITTQSPQV
jgi:hypothetical protein